MKGNQKLKSMSTDMKEIMINSNYNSTKENNLTVEDAMQETNTLGIVSRISSNSPNYKRRRSSHQNLLTKISTIIECSIIGYCDQIGE